MLMFNKYCMYLQTYEAVPFGGRYFLMITPKALFAHIYPAPIHSLVTQTAAARARCFAR